MIYSSDNTLSLADAHDVRKGEGFTKDILEKTRSDETARILLYCFSTRILTANIIKDNPTYLTRNYSLGDWQ